MPFQGASKAARLRRAVHALAASFPEAFIQNSVGARFEL